MQPKDGKSPQPVNVQKPSKPVAIEITFYTDPLCCWTWAMQPQWKKLLNELQNVNPSVRYKMGGLLPSWNHFTDNVNSIQRPVQMGPEWMHARAVSGAEINDRIWMTDPPASSFPASIAVKCAGFQSPELARDLLYLLQEAVMAKNLNIAKNSVLLDVASVLKLQSSIFDLERFKEDLFGVTGKEAFRKDLQECKYLNIRRLPTILFTSANKNSLLLSGYQSYDSLKSACIKLELIRQ